MHRASTQTAQGLYDAIQTQDFRSFPHAFTTFATALQNPGRMARHLAAYPRLYDLITAILTTDPERG